MSTLGERITEARKGKHWMQQTLADNIGASKSAVSLYERNLRKPMEAVLMSIASVTGVNFRWLNSGQGDKYGEAEDIRAVEDEFILNALSGKEKETLLRFLKLDSNNRKSLRMRMNVWIERLEKLHEEEGC